MPNNRVALLILGAGKPFSGEQHTALRSAGGSARVLDWSLHAVAFLEPEHYFVCGYQAEAIRAIYPEFHYISNSEWETTRAGWSLLQGLPKSSGDCMVAYADILFRRKTVERMMASPGDVVVAVDSLWRTRYSGRKRKDLERCEKACLAGTTVTRLGAAIPTALASTESIGLIRLTPRALELLHHLQHTTKDDDTLLRQASLSDILEMLRLQGLQVNAVDVCGDWAELNEAADLARFVLGTKAQSLHRLRGMVACSRIEEQVSFTVAQWHDEASAIVRRIQEQFAGRNVVVRSSALSEDGFLHSNAGAYTSLLNVNSNCHEALSQAVDKVIASYSDGNPANEVLVQPMLTGVCASGVVFTRTLAGGAPYYVANYDDVTGSTASITSGNSREHKTLIMRRDADRKNPAIPPLLAGLLPALHEIESLLGYDSLDVEFAITEEQAPHILQVRPIAVDHSGWGDGDEVLYDLLAQAEGLFVAHQPASPFVLGTRTVFGVMPDWNPAEIIGTRPKRLATDLYRFLVLSETWAKQRTEFGYRDVRPQSLLVSFAGQPYIDVRASFNSFIPASLPDNLAARLVDFFLDWLVKHPHLHDKVEFEVVPTCFALDFERWRQRLMRDGGFSAEETAQLQQALREITTTALCRYEQDYARINELEFRFARLRDTSMEPLAKAWLLLHDCRDYGVLPFAHLARGAFIAVTLLKSACHQGVVTREQMDDFLATIRTVSHTLADDAIRTADGELSWDNFVARYGHLRPGTYDITSPCYHADPEFYLRPLVQRAQHGQRSGNTAAGALWNEARADFAMALTNAGIHGEVEAFESFMHRVIEGREYAKFAFTRNLSLALELIAQWGAARGISREELAHLALDDIFSVHAGTLAVPDITAWLRQRAQEACAAHEQRIAVELPPLICRREDFSVFEYPSTQANFIGSGHVCAACIELSAGSEESELAGKIVLIPQADPGYDWIFGRDIAGLITMYGGANSHMAIRAAEFGLPAAIGIGEKRYRELGGAAVLDLNAGTRQVRGIA